MALLPFFNVLATPLEGGSSAFLFWFTLLEVVDWDEPATANCSDNVEISFALLVDFFSFNAVLWLVDCRTGELWCVDDCLWLFVSDLWCRDDLRVIELCLELFFDWGNDATRPDIWLISKVGWRDSESFEEVGSGETGIGMATVGLGGLTAEAEMLFGLPTGVVLLYTLLVVGTVCFSKSAGI